jgi:hypothetical protein
MSLRVTALLPKPIVERFGRVSGQHTLRCRWPV